MSQNSNDQKIVIDLNQTDTKGFDATNFIQVQARDKLFELINKFLGQIPDKFDSKERVHHTILIQGKRGSGKTSFILSVKKQINEGFKNPNNDIPTPKDLVILDIIDPTLIESKEHVFINIITRIKEKVEEEKKNRDSKSSEFNEWKESLKKLAGGISMLDGVGSYDLKDNLWDSPELALEKGLSNSKHGYKLEENFKRFIHQSLRMLNQKAFVLILDDIDTSLNEGRLILETIRKYLTSPQLITILLGDIELYSTLVRQLQWEKIDPKHTLEKYELKENREQYVSQIEHLEEQYLTKILMPEYRIDLLSLYVLNENLMIGNISIAEYLKEYIKENFFEKGKEANLYAELILTQPLRSCLQILKVDSKQDIWSTKIKHTFITTLQKHLKKYDLMDDVTENNYLNKLSNYILHEQFSRDNHLKLLPEFKDSEKNILMLYLNSLGTATLKPSQYLSYFIKIGYALEQFYQLKNQDNKDVDRFIDHIAIDSSEPTARVSKRLLTTFEFYTKEGKVANIDSNTHTTNPIFFGNLSLSQDMLSSLSKPKNLSLLLSKVHNPKTKKQYLVISFFNLIGILSDILELGENKDSNNHIKNYLTRNSLIRDYFTYGYDQANIVIDEYLEDDTEDNIYEFDENNLSEIIEWANKINEIKLKLPLSVLAKIWIRTVYTFVNIESRSENRSKNYFELLELYISGFLNAVLVQVELFRDKKVDISNPNRSPKVFYNKLENYEKSDTFFDHLYACPIFQNLDSYFEYLKLLEIKDDFSKLTEKEQNKKMNEAYKSIEDPEFKKKIEEFNTLDLKEQTTVKNKFASYIKKMGYTKGFGIKILRKFIVEA